MTRMVRLSVAEARAFGKLLQTTQTPIGLIVKGNRGAAIFKLRRPVFTKADATAYITAHALTLVNFDITLDDIFGEKSSCNYEQSTENIHDNPELMESK